MTKQVHGFTEVKMSDHEFGAWLRRHKADQNYQIGPANGNTWYGPDGRAVACCIYDNLACTNSVWLRLDLGAKL